jgi:ligand-binding sensor domain-containing protein
MIKIMIYSLLLLLYVGYSPAQNWTSYTTEENGLVDNDVRAVVIDPFGSKWFATAAGLSRLNGG